MINNVYENLINEMNSGVQAVMITYLSSDDKIEGVNPHKVLLTKEDMQDKNLMTNIGERLYEQVVEVMESGGLEWGRGVKEELVLIEPYHPKPKLIIFGGGHIALPLVEFGAKLGYEITVIDDRPTFANTERFPEPAQVICESFEKCFNNITLNKSTFVVIVTRGHRNDIECLRQILNYETAYVGMIGSKLRVKLVKDNLLNEGYSSENLNRIHAPIGLDIGAVTPEEIAISILSEIISVRRLRKKEVNGVSKFQKNNRSEFDIGVMDELAKKEDGPRAIATVISTKGSTPRHAGAKMIIWPFGRIIGSIGGGCCEAEVIITARDILKTGGHSIKMVDMTNDDAEKEGMVCGGTMEVLIEYYSY